MRRERVCSSKEWLGLMPSSFQGNRDESTNVDMSLVQRDVQVSLVAGEVPVWAS